MKNFLHDTCLDIYSKHKTILKDSIIVFPNKRAGVFFKKHLKDIVKETIWLPKITTLNEFIEDLSSLQKEDNMSLIFRLYNIYKKHTNTSESFDDFYYWGETLLNDFDDIDKYLVDAKDLFKNLQSLKEIETEFEYLSQEQINAIKKFWNSFNIDKISNNQQEFIKIWEKLYLIYSDFKEELSKDASCYEGMSYRNIVDKIENKSLSIKTKKIIIIGFNALNKCEERLFTHLEKSGIAEFYWDYDSYYVDNINNEAGVYMRKNLKSFPNNFSADKFNYFRENKKTIEIYSVPSDIGQTKILSTQLETLAKEKIENNAIILGDENLLIPTIHSIPSNIEAVNVTMGYPAQNSTVAGFIKNIIDLQISAKNTNKDGLFYHKPIIAILNHQFINSIEANEDIKNITLQNKVYITKAELSVDVKTLDIFEYPKTGVEAGKYLLKILHETFNKLEIVATNDDLVKIEKEYLYHLYLSIKRTNSILEQYSIELTPKTYYHIISKIVKGLSIPFEGEPLAGLQVMGLMETRLLDFENLYILSANEGKLPKISSSQSYVPYNLRKGFGLPTIEHQDSIYAYYFYRLIQRAKNIKFYYSTRSDGMKTGEMSRFLYQLKYESGFEIIEKNVVNEISVENNKEISYKKDASVIEKLNLLTTNKDRPFSPSAINEYLSCKLKFYFKYIADLKEEDELIEDIDPRIFGMIFHDTMENIYKNQRHKEIKTEFIDNLLKNIIEIELILTKAFNTHYLKNTRNIIIDGKDKIIYDILLKYIKEVLKKDREICPFTVLATEGRYHLEIDVEGQTRFIGGSIDRVDETNSAIRVLDYKTGKADTVFTTVEDLFSEDYKRHNKAALQTLLYCMMYEPKCTNNKEITPGIYALKEIFSNKYEYRLSTKIDKKTFPLTDYREHKTELKKGLESLITEILDTNICFSQTEDEKACGYCPYKELCHK